MPSRTKIHLGAAGWSRCGLEGPPDRYADYPYDSYVTT